MSAVETSSGLGPPAGGAQPRWLERPVSCGLGLDAVPGVLKNALDWASRPIGRSVLIDKPVLAMSVSPASTGGVRAQAQVHETLLSIPAHIVTGPQLVIGNVAEKIREGRLVEEPILRFALSAIHRFAAACNVR